MQYWDYSAHDGLYPGIGTEGYPPNGSKLILLNAMIWTSSPPQSPGWYWFRRLGGEMLHVVYVMIEEDGFFWTANESALNDEGQWAGPIAPPIE